MSKIGERIVDYGMEFSKYLVVGFFGLNLVKIIKHFTKETI